MLRIPVRLIVLLFLTPSFALAAWQPAGVPICTAPYTQIHQQMCADEAGSAIIVWHDTRSGDMNNSDLYAQRISISGAVSWTTNGVPICTAERSQEYPVIVPDGHGGATVAWSDPRDLLTGRDIYVQRINASGTVLWSENGLAVCRATNAQINPALLPVGDGSVFVVWEDYRDGNADIYAQWVSSSGSFLWGNGVAVCALGGNQTNPQVTDGTGLIVMWEDRSSGNVNLYAQRLVGGGTKLWGPDGAPVCTIAGDQKAPRLTMDYNSGAIVAWYDSRNGNADIFAQRIDGFGTRLWAPDGSPLCAAAGDQDYPIIVSDPAGAVVAWQDNRIFHDIYAQRVDLSGAPQWTVNGVALCTAAGYQLYPVGIPDLSGGAIIAWSDYRDTTADIYAQRVDWSGAIWTTDGVGLCTADLNQSWPAIASDGRGGALVTWAQQEPADEFDIYAGLVTNAGLVPTAVEDTPSAGALLVRAPYPNPFAGTTTLEIFVPATSGASVEVYDVAGRRMRSETFGEMESGWRRITLDANADSGGPLPSGVYFCRVRAAGKVATSKMVIAR